jgi:hypothetical protein
VAYIYGQFFNGHMTSGGLKVVNGTKIINMRTGETSWQGSGSILSFNVPAINNAGVLVLSALVGGTGSRTQGVFIATSQSLQRPRRRP